MRQCDVVVIVM